MPPSDIAKWVVLSVFSALLLVAGWNDIKVRRIPNWSVVALLILFAVQCVVIGPVNIFAALEASAFTFAFSFVLYALNMIGAGDSKLMTAVALFVGLRYLPQFIVLMALLGGILALVNLALDPARAWALVQMRGKGSDEHTVPYGVAIAIAALAIVLSRSAGIAIPVIGRIHWL